MYTQYHTLADGHREIHVVTHGSLLNVPAEAAIVMGNGAFATPTSLARFGRSMVQAAADEGRNIAFVTHSDPYLGRAYAQDYRTERLDRVTRDTANHYPGTHLVGHSWSWAPALQVAAGMRWNMPLDSLVAYTPADHPDLLVDRNILTLLNSVRREAFQADGFAGGLGSLSILSCIVAQMGVRLAANPAMLCGEVYRSFRTDSTRRVAALPAEVPAGFLLANHDKFYPAAVVRERLDIAGFTGPVATIEATHLSAVTNPAHAPELYRFAMRVAAGQAAAE